ncbi:MAG: hypothetical protein P1U37_00220 [Minwuia sp.]|nr:hypothetical protein [Minwuia sp.]
MKRLLRYRCGVTGEAVALTSGDNRPPAISITLQPAKRPVYSTIPDHKQRNRIRALLPMRRNKRKKCRDNRKQRNCDKV